MLTLNGYQHEAMKFRLDTANYDYALKGIVGEMGELFSLLAKATRDGYSFNHDQNVKKELGDILWFLAAISLDHGFTLNDIAEANILKLESRKERNVIKGSGDDR
jgi:NTP pyrophosphatase (non-canonical NTP hydrolase)